MSTAYLCARFGVILDGSDDCMQRGGDGYASQQTVIVNVDRDDRSESSGLMNKARTP